MANWLLGFGSMLIPLAFVIKLSDNKTFSDSSWVTVLMVTGFVCLAWSLVNAQVDEHERRRLEKLGYLTSQKTNMLLLIMATKLGADVDEIAKLQESLNREFERITDPKARGKGDAK